MTPPRLARALLSFALPHDVRASVLTELDDEYTAHIRPVRGWFGASTWYWRQVLGSVPHAIQMRWRRRAGHATARAERNGEGMLATVLFDLRFGGRYLAKRPVFAAAAVLTLALGIGANTAIFTIVDSVVFTRLPYPGAERMVRIWSANPRGIPRNSVSPADFFDFRDQAQGPHAFDMLAAFTPPDAATLRGVAEPARVTATMVSPSLFDLLGVEPVAGRTLAERDATGVTTAGAVVSERLWRTRFNGILGAEVSVDGIPYTIVGAMPRSFDFPVGDVDVWVPLPEYKQLSRSAHFLNVVGRVAQHSSLDHAESVLRTIAARLEGNYPDTNKGWGVTIAGLQESMIADVRRPLLVLLVTSACVLLIACANVASLFLAHGIARTRELALRTALGATRRRIVRQQLLESGIIAMGGGAVGVMLASFALQVLRQTAMLDLPRLAGIAIDRRVLVVAALASVLSAIVSGLLPALRIARANPTDMLKAGQSPGPDRAARRSRSVLVTAQVAMTTSLMIAAALLSITLVRLMRVDAGFNADRVLLAQVSLTVARYDPKTWSSFFGRALEEIRALPGVVAAGAVDPLPLSGRDGLMRFGVRIEGRPDPAPGEFDRTYLRRATPHYFSAMGIPLVSGTLFEESDRAESKPVAIVDTTFADRYFPGQNPLGRRVRSTNDRTFREVIGVVGAVRQTALDEPAAPHLYVAQSQNPTFSMTFAIRTTADPQELAASVNEAIRRVDPQQPVFNVRTLRDFVSGSAASERRNAFTVALFAGTALVLALVGVYGLVAGWVTESTREIGLRMALGATRAEVYALVLGRGLRLALTGVVLGIGMALAGTRLLASMLFGVGPFNPGVFAGAAVAMVLATLLATWIPARRALGIDPASALRAD